MSRSEWTLENIEGPTHSNVLNVSWLVLLSGLILPQHSDVSFPATTQHHDMENIKHGSSMKRNELQNF